MLRTWGTIALLNDNISSSSKWLIKCCCVTGLCISIKEPYWKTANSTACASLWGLCIFSLGSLMGRGESSFEQSGTNYKKSFLQTTECRNKLWRMIQLDTLFPSLGLILLLHLVYGIRASEQPCCYYSQSFPSSRVCMALSVFWN